MERTVRMECDPRDDSLYVASKGWERVMDAAVKVCETFLDREPSPRRGIYVITRHSHLTIVFLDRLQRRGAGRRGLGAARGIRRGLQGRFRDRLRAGKVQGSGCLFDIHVAASRGRGRRSR